MACNDHQGHINDKNARRLIWAFAVIVVFMVVETVGGVISGSLALLADAAHMLTDAVALALAASAQFLARRPPTGQLHFGYRRLKVLAAFANGVLLVGLLAMITVEAIVRFANPREINAELMLGVAAIGLLANIAAFLILHRRDERDLNMRGAMLHVLSDLFGSAAAILAAGVIILTGWVRVDPVLSVLVAILIGVSAYRLLRETGHILLEGSPKDISRAELKAGLEHASPLIRNVHNIHVWQLTPDALRLTLHAHVAKAEDAPEALSAIKTFLETTHAISHSTIQIEVEGAGCPDGKSDPRVAYRPPQKLGASAPMPGGAVYARPGE
ncbi:MAG: cation diffusion facilitator family transporter [Pseudomonadota bacterium]